MGKPAARQGDEHVCPVVTPGGVPHKGGPIRGTGYSSVLIEGVASAVAGNSCTCAGAIDKIVSGSGNVFIEGKPAARKGDKSLHGGTVTTGSGTVFIGGRTVSITIEIENDEFVEPSEEEKAKLIEQAIKDCIVLLERKLALMESGDADTMKAFKKWFGRDDEEAVEMILQRIRNVLIVAYKLSLKNFDNLIDEEEREIAYAKIYPNDNSYRIFLAKRFWEAVDYGMNSKGGILIHEISHLKEIGGTFDHADGQRNCLGLAKDYPEDAINNADSFEYFIES